MSVLETSVPHLQTSGPLPQERSGRLGRKLVVQILLLNAMLSIFASSIQLYVGYQRDRNDVLSSISVIDDSFRNGFQDALWEYNFPLVKALLDGVYSKPDVQFLTLTTGEDRSWTLGDPSDNAALVETLTFTHENDAGQVYQMGVMEVGLTFEHIKARVWSQLWTLLLSNFAKTILASGLLYLLFQRSVGRHLSSIAARVSQRSWADTDTLLTLDRLPQGLPDDLDQIVHSINEAKTESRKSLRALNDEIQQRRSVEKTLRLRTRALENANREQSQFTYAISHDLKSPANTIAMLLKELDVLEGDSIGADSAEVLGDAMRTVERMTQLVEDILGYARTIEQGMQVERVDLNTVVQEVIEDLQGDIVSAQAGFNVSKLPIVDGNRVQLRMLMQNLVNNAIKFRAPGRSPEIVISTQNQEDPPEVSILVSDNGIGIQSKYQKRVFELFQRLHSHGDYGGSGLGLTLCKRIAINHSGDISLSSKQGEGTTFEVRIPRRDNDKKN